MATLEEFKTECRTELQTIRDNDGLFKQVVDAAAGTSERVPITDDEFEQMVVDCADGKFDAQENGYKKARREAYPEISEQLDLLFHDMAAGKGDNTGEWYKAINQVKSDNPKP